MKIYTWIQSHRIKLIGGIGLSFLLFFLIGYVLAPTLIYDQFIWKYFWGPIVSDAVGNTVSHNGVVAAEKYTLISEIIYGLLIATVLFGVYTLFHRWDIKVNNSFFFAALPYVIFGSIARVLEDAHFFVEPFIYWFISPLIYIQILLWFLFFLIIGHYLKKWIHRNVFHEQSFIFIGGMLLLVLSIILTIQHIISLQQNEDYFVRFDIFAVVFVLVGGVCLIVYLVSRLYRTNTLVASYGTTLNLAMLSGHLLDGFTSWISIYDPFNMGIIGYYEKHPASNFLMEVWPPLFPIVKFLLIIGVVFVFDIIYKDELKQYKQLITLLKIGIFILGFAPGLRDLLRVMMGV